MKKIKISIKIRANNYCFWYPPRRTVSGGKKPSKNAILGYRWYYRGLYTPYTPKIGHFWGFPPTDRMTPRMTHFL